ncbi:MAG TPA: flagellar hook-basal body complex protein FliE [Noviherbaspirillum sp.]|nr:flagellar hook-basal body complex protein FliE [Noviherbaspirillum sp.]
MIDSGRIEAMIAQLRAAANPTANRPIAGVAETAAAEKVAPKLDFAAALKNSLDQVNSAQRSSEALTQRFAMGDDSVSLSDVMINSQKASISFHATVQVRNKLVSAYQDIMNMSV